MHQAARLDRFRDGSAVRIWRIVSPQFAPAGGRRAGCRGSGILAWYAGCKSVIGLRLKRSGMFRTVRGARAIIARRCCRISGRFEDYREQDRVADARIRGAMRLADAAPLTLVKSAGVGQAFSLPGLLPRTASSGHRHRRRHCGRGHGRRHRRRRQIHDPFSDGLH